MTAPELDLPDGNSTSRIYLASNLSQSLMGVAGPRFGGRSRARPCGPVRRVERQHRAALLRREHGHLAAGGGRAGFGAGPGGRRPVRDARPAAGLQRRGGRARLRRSGLRAMDLLRPSGRPVRHRGDQADAGGEPTAGRVGGGGHGLRAAPARVEPGQGLRRLHEGDPGPAHARSGSRRRCPTRRSRTSSSVSASLARPGRSPQPLALQRQTSPGVSLARAAARQGQDRPRVLRCRGGVRDAWAEAAEARLAHVVPQGRRAGSGATGRQARPKRHDHPRQQLVGSRLSATRARATRAAVCSRRTRRCSACRSGPRAGERSAPADPTEPSTSRRRRQPPPRSPGVCTPTPPASSCACKGRTYAAQSGRSLRESDVHCRHDAPPCRAPGGSYTPMRSSP